jgi:superfamily II DNA/RNA helicase
LCRQLYSYLRRRRWYYLGPGKESAYGSADIIVSTPGKLISHLNLGYVKLDTLEHLVLDEADRMLDMAFMKT